MTPFSIKIFVADGDPDGLRLVERSNWIGKAVMFPRTLLPAIRHREEFAKTGVYLLLGPQEDGEGQRLYVGEADPCALVSISTMPKRISGRVPCSLWLGRGT